MSARTEYVARLRKLADLLEATPDLIFPYNVSPHEITFLPSGAAETAVTAKLLPSSWAKNDPNKSDYDATYYVLTGEWLGVKLTIIESRKAVCERVRVGTERVTVPAAEAIPETVVSRPVYKWQCEPLLAKAVAS